jgi:alginate O-acetyltransferase complex protein AlgI
LIAGPVLHHKQMMPQFASPFIYKPNYESIAVGLTLFSFGLFKKVILADQFALFANPVFNGAAQLDSHPMFFEAWIGVLAYTLQLYFDFSGYSDMAIGLSRMFNVKLPLNFNSPYKAANIIDFWRRWHMTLSKFLRDYLYVPLGGNRKGPARRHFNLMATMLLGGLWHGAGWTFVLWGGLHGLYLILNHAWRKLTCTTGIAKNRLTHAISVVITFISVMIAWVPFRAVNINATTSLLKGMAGLNGISFPVQFTGKFEKYLPGNVEFSGISLGGVVGIVDAAIWLPFGLLIIWALPNTQQWLSKYSPAYEDVISKYTRLVWHWNRRYAILVGIMFAIALLALSGSTASEFLYYQF